MTCISTAFAILALSALIPVDATLNSVNETTVAENIVQPALDKAKKNKKLMRTEKKVSRTTTSEAEAIVATEITHGAEFVKSGPLDFHAQLQRAVSSKRYQEAKQIVEKLLEIEAEDAKKQDISPHVVLIDQHKHERLGYTEQTCSSTGGSGWCSPWENGAGDLCTGASQPAICNGVSGGYVSYAASNTETDARALAEAACDSVDSCTGFTWTSNNLQAKFKSQITATSPGGFKCYDKSTSYAEKVCASTEKSGWCLGDDNGTYQSYATMTLAENACDSDSSCLGFTAKFTSTAVKIKLKTTLEGVQPYAGSNWLYKSYSCYKK